MRTDLEEKPIWGSASNADDALLPSPRLRGLDGRLAVFTAAVLLDDGVHFGPVAGGFGVEGAADEPLGLGMAQEPANGVAIDVEINNLVFAEVRNATTAGLVGFEVFVHVVAFERGRLAELEVGIRGREEEQAGGKQRA